MDMGNPNDFGSEIATLSQAAELAHVDLPEGQHDYWRDTLGAARFLTRLARDRNDGHPRFLGEMSLIAAGDIDHTAPALRPYIRRVASLPQKDWEHVFKNLHNLGEEIGNQREATKATSLANFAFRSGSAVAGLLQIPAGPGDDNLDQFNHWLEKAFGYAFLVSTAEHARSLHVAQAIKVPPNQATERVLLKRAKAVRLSEELGTSGYTLAAKLGQLVESNWTA